MGRAEAALPASETPFSVSVAAGLLFLWGLVALAALVLTAFAGVDAPPSYPLGLWFTAGLAGGVLCIAASIWLSRLDRHALPAVGALAILSFGKALGELARGEFDGGALIHVALPSLALYAVLRHRRLFRQH
jgi:hypothetical protein